MKKQNLSKKGTGLERITLSKKFLMQIKNMIA